MAGGIEELLTMLYDMVQDAWSVPLGADRCILERDKVLDLISEISNALPADLKQARTIVETRNEILGAAKREADAIKRQAEERGRQLVSEHEVLIAARQKANDFMTSAETKSRELVKATNDYVEDVLKRTEEAITQAAGEVRQSRVKFRSAAKGSGDK